MCIMGVHWFGCGNTFTHDKDCLIGKEHPVQKCELVAILEGFDADNCEQCAERNYGIGDVQTDGWRWMVLRGLEGENWDVVAYLPSLRYRALLYYW
jgi:hypothetical protein